MKGAEFFFKFLPKITGLFLYLRIYSNQWKSLSQLNKIQLKKLLKLINYSKKNVPIYQKLFENNSFKIKFFNSLSDIRKLPVIKKSYFNQHYEDFISRQINPLTCKKDTTSGSTGEPTTILYDKDCQKFNYAIEYRHFFAIGIKPQHRHVVIADAPYIPKVNTFGKNIYYSTISHLSVYEDPSILSKYLQRINPKIIHGPPSIMEAIAQYINENRIKNITPRIIICGGEVLDIKAREIIERVFNTKIFETYGCTEIPNIAWECKSHSGLHINMDNVVVEIVKNGNYCAPGEIGQIIVTALNNRAIPLIRYEIGDLGVITDEICPCGRKLPMLKQIYGRIIDLLYLPNGKRTHPWILLNKIREVPSIKQLQIIQEKEDLIIIRIVENLFNGPTDKASIINICKKILGNEITFKIKIVSKIERSHDGKYHVVISKMHL